MDTLQLDKLDKEYTLEDFENRINPWCMKYAVILNVAESEMCSKAVEIFKDRMCQTTIRNAIDSRYKMQYRVTNALMKKSNKLERLKKFGRDTLGLSTDEIIRALADPTYQASEFLSEKERK